MAMERRIKRKSKCYRGKERSKEINVMKRLREEQSYGEKKRGTEKRLQ